MKEAFYYYNRITVIIIGFQLVNKNNGKFWLCGDNLWKIMFYNLIVKALPKFFDNYFILN